MGGIFTDKRTIEVDETYTAQRQDVPNPQTFAGKFPQIQTVTSYRSGRKYDGRTLSNAEILSSAQENGSFRNTSYDNGHEFLATKQEVKHSHSNFFTYDPNGRAWFRGCLVAGKTLGVDPSTLFRQPPTIDTSYYGNLAIKNTRPTTPVAGLAQFLGELHEGVPRLIGTEIPRLMNAVLLREKAEVFRVLGGSYLNVEFGWKPFISDLTKMFNAVTQSSKILEQFEKDTDKNIRRRFGFKPIISSQITYDQPNAFGINLVGTGMSGLFKNGQQNVRLVEAKTSFQKYSFSGAYTYHLENRKDLLAKVKHYEQLANKLLGVRLTPEVLWELTPWSWLADWYGTIGLMTGNAVAFQNDGLVLRYGYLMRESVYRTIRTATVDLSTGKQIAATSMYSFTQKERVRSTPFGFGSNPSSFTARQWAILAALGMTKAPKILR